MGAGVARSHLVTRAEMMSVMVALTSASISSRGGDGQLLAEVLVRICCGSAR